MVGGAEPDTIVILHRPAIFARTFERTAARLPCLSFLHFPHTQDAYASLHCGERWKTCLTTEQEREAPLVPALAAPRARGALSPPERELPFRL